MDTVKPDVILNERIGTDLKTSDFAYDLPPELIAQHPTDRRDASRLMVIHRADGSVEHRHFYDITDYIAPEDVLVINDSKVIPARLYGHAEGREEARLELLLLRQHELDTWECLVKPGKRARIGARCVFGNGILTGEVTDILEEGNRLIRFSFDHEKYENIYNILHEIGLMPLPPYITEQLQDNDRYQTVYARTEGSAAAPTAGLHFTSEVLADIDARGIGREEVTLHVGAGTFKPVKSDTIEGHEMHTEFISVRRSSIERIKSNLGNIIAVGTTSVRTLESLYYMGVILDNNPEATSEDLVVKQWMPYDMNNNRLTAERSLQNILDYLDKHDADTLVTATQIIIAPGYEFKIVKGIVTNFHQPKSTLLLLISAFVKGNWKSIYEYALEHDFRFLSYGDSSLLI